MYPFLPHFVSRTQRCTVVPNVKNPPKHKFAQGDFTRFSMKVSANSHNFRFQLPALHIQNLSNRCRHKYYQSISQIFESCFWRGFTVWPNCAVVSGYESQETRAIALGGRVVVRATIANQDVIQLHGALLKGFFVEKLPIFLSNSFIKT